MQTQQAFSGALLNPELKVPKHLIQPNGEVANERFGVYRNNVVSALLEAMSTGFPVVQKLLGEEYFHALAAVFVRQHPPTSPVVAEYGEAFPGFIQGFEPLKQFPYLADVAKLELLRRSSHNAADCVSCAAGQLAAISPEQLMHVVPVAHPSLRMMTSTWPVHEIWGQQSGLAPDARPDMNCGSQSLQIVRPEMQLMQYAVGPEQECFARSIDGVNRLASIAETVLEKFPNCDFIQLMVLMIQRGTIAKFLLPEEANA